MYKYFSENLGKDFDSIELLKQAEADFYENKYFEDGIVMPYVSKPLTKKQSKSRSKSKLAKKSRKINRRK